MQGIIDAGKFIGRNWKWLAILFGLGGTATVVAVIPNVPGKEQFGSVIQERIDATKGKLEPVSPTAF